MPPTHLQVPQVLPRRPWWLAHGRYAPTGSALHRPGGHHMVLQESFRARRRGDGTSTTPAV